MTPLLRGFWDLEQPRPQRGRLQEQPRPQRGRLQGAVTPRAKQIEQMEEFINLGLPLWSETMRTRHTSGTLRPFWMRAAGWLLAGGRCAAPESGHSGQATRDVRGGRGVEMRRGMRGRVAQCGLAAMILAAGLMPRQAEAAYSGTGTFKPITSPGEITAGGYYVFVGGATYGATAMGTLTGSILGVATVTTASSQIVNPPATNVWRIDGNSTAWAIYSEAGGYYIGHRATGNAVSTAASSTSTQYGWTFATTVSSAFVIRNVGSTLRVLMYNSGAPRFVAYSSAQHPVRLYKMEAAASAPTVTTLPESSVAATSAVLGGNARRVYGLG